MIKIIDLYSGNDFVPGQLVMDGYSGVIFKAGQGAWADVPRYHPDWWQMAKDAGLKVGWYWLVDSRYPSADHLDEMDRFHILDDLGELGLWADVEKPVISMTEAEYWKTPYAGSAQVVDFVYLVRLRGVKIGIYTGPGAFDLICGGASQTRKDYLSESELWTAQYTSAPQPNLYGAWKSWVWWQQREGPDVNVFNGSDAEFYAKYGGVQPPPPTGENMLKGTVLVDLNIRPSADTTQAAIGKLLKNDLVEASERINGWWKLSKITRGGVNIPLPAASCYSYEGASSGYIRLDEIVDVPPPPTATLPVINLHAIGYPDIEWKPLT